MNFWYRVKYIYNSFKYKTIKKKKVHIAQQNKKKANVRKRFDLEIKKHLNSAGMEPDVQKVNKVIFMVSLGIMVFMTILLVFLSLTRYNFGGLYVFYITFLLWTLGFLIIYFINWYFFHIYIDIKRHYRKVAVEEVLPDFLQLTSSNIKAGMNIDRALWFAVRPRFGILAKEIEKVAKQTMSGEDLNKALTEFSERYDSNILKRSMSLLTEGIKAGGEVGDLLNKIASNIQETKIIKKEMAANVTTYAVFISFASVVAAPILFALSSQIINVVQTLGQTLDLSSSGQAGIGISFTGSSVTLGDFRIFAIVMLIITSFFSAVIVATIKKGSAKDGLRYIPIFIFSSIAIFLLISYVLKNFVSGFF